MYTNGHTRTNFTEAILEAKTPARLGRFAQDAWGMEGK